MAMKKKQKLTAFILVFLFTIGSVALMAVYLDKPAEKTVSVFSESARAYIAPKVYDAYSNKPIEGAAVCIVEGGSICYSGADGACEPIPVPDVRDPRYDGLFAKSWKEVTVVAYKEGYAPYIAFDVSADDGKTVQGPYIYMAKSNSDSPTYTVEAPKKEWVEKLLEAVSRNTR